MRLRDDVTMPSVPGSIGWIRELRNDRYGQPSAIVVWEHHNGVRALIPVRKLEVVREEL